MPDRRLSIQGHALLSRFGILLLAVLLQAVQAQTAHAGSLTLAKSKLIWPSFGMAFPTGRFGKTDTDANPPKIGQKTGFAPALDAGYFVNEFLSLGVSGDFVRFRMDHGKLEAPKSAHTTVVSGNIWARLFPPGGYEHWRPYLVVGVGLGRPKAKIEYQQPFELPVGDSTILCASQESRVRTSLSLMGGLGVLVPVSPVFGLTLESRYRSLSTKGVNRTDAFTTPEGAVLEFDTGKDASGNPVRLKSKSNTTWWELRVGLAVMIP